MLRRNDADQATMAMMLTALKYSSVQGSQMLDSIVVGADTDRWYEITYNKNMGVHGDDGETGEYQIFEVISDNSRYFATANMNAVYNYIRYDNFEHQIRLWMPTEWYNEGIDLDKCYKTMDDKISLIKRTIEECDDLTRDNVTEACDIISLTTDGFLDAPPFEYKYNWFVEVDR